MKEIKSWYSEAEEDTVAIARELAGRFKPNDVVLFDGDLGSGKTFLVKALCRIWQTTDEAVSPTFAILHQYRGPQPVNHFDLYRIERVEELDNLGWEEFLEMDAVTFIEWPQLIEPRLESYYKIEIRIKNGRRQFKLYAT
jgi:tRNA threonylcarbamoyl adenosine modification protein YjeE